MQLEGFDRLVKQKIDHGFGADATANLEAVGVIAIGARTETVVFDEYLNYPGWKDGEWKAFQEVIAARKLNYRLKG